MDETPCNNLYDDKLMAYIYDDVDDSDIFAFKPSVQDSDGSKNVQDNITLNTALPSTNTVSSSIIAENDELKLKIKQLESEKNLLELRISEVYRTAKAELERKDKRLLQLNDEINNLVFRRKDINSQPYKQPYKVQDTARNNVFHHSQPRDSSRENYREVRQKLENSEPSTHYNSNVQVERESNDVLLISDEDVTFVQTVYELKTDASDKSEVEKMESKPELRRSPRKSAGTPRTIKNELKSCVRQVHEEKNVRDSNNVTLKLNKKINEDCLIKSDDVFIKENRQYVHTNDSKNHLKLKGEKTLRSISNSERDKSHRCSERINNIDRSKSKSSNSHQDYGERYAKSESMSKTSEGQNLISNASNFASSKDVKSKENNSESRRARSEARDRNGPRTPSDSPPSSLSRNKTSKRTDRRSLSKSPRRYHRTCKTYRSISPLRTHRHGKSVKEQLKSEVERFELRSRSRGDISFRTKDRDRRRSPGLSCFSKSVVDTRRSEKILDQRDRYGNIIASTYGEWRKLSKLQKEIEVNKEEDRELRKKDRTSLKRNQIDYGDIDTEIRRDELNRKECDTKPIESFKSINKLCKPDLKSSTQNDESELINKNQKTKVVKDEVNIISNNGETQNDSSELLKNNHNNTVLINDNSFLHDLSMSDDEDDNTFEKMEPIKDDKVEMKISILDVVVIPADSSLSLSRTPDTKKDTVPNVSEASTESHSRKNSGNFECIEQIQEAIHTNVLRPEHTTSMISLSELDTEELQKCLEDGIPQSPILPQINPDNVIDSKSPNRPFNERIIHLFGSDSPVKSESIAKFDEMQVKKLGKNLADLPTGRKTGAAQETTKVVSSKPKMRKSRCQTADAALPEMLNKRNLDATKEGGLRSFDLEDMNYSIIPNNLHYIPVLSVQTARIKSEHEMPTKKEQPVVKCAETTITESKVKRKKICKQQKAKIKVKMPFNEQNKKDKRIEKCKTKRAKCIGDGEKATPSKSRPRVSKKKQQTKVKEISQDNTDVNFEDIAHRCNQGINEEVQKTVSKKHQEQNITSEFESPPTPSVKVKRKNKNITEAVEDSPKEEQKTDAAEERKTQTRRITPVKIGEVDTSTTGNLMEGGTKKRKINTTFKDERPGKVQKTSVEFGISSQSPLPHIEGMLKLFERKTSATHVYTDCHLGSTKTTSSQRKLSDLAETNAVDASNDNTVNQINLDSKDVSLLGTLEKVILDNMTEYLGDKSLHSFGSEDKTRSIKTTHNEPYNGNEYADNLDFSNMLEKNLNTSTPMKSLKENSEVDVPQVSTNHHGKQIDSGSTSVATNDFSVQTNCYKSYLVTPMKRDRRKRVRVVQLIQKT